MNATLADLTLAAITQDFETQYDPFGSISTTGGGATMDLNDAPFESNLSAGATSSSFIFTLYTDAEWLIRRNYWFIRKERGLDGLLVAA